MKSTLGEKGLTIIVEVGVIGCGKIAEKHLSAYDKIDGVEAIVTDKDSAKAKSLADSYGTKWCKTFDELLSEYDINAVDVCTPTPTHAKIVSRSLSENKHVFCEKPLAQTERQVKKIMKMAKEKDLLVMVGYLYRYHPAFKLAERIINNNIIGEPYFALFRLGGRGSHRKWKHESDKGGGAANEMFVHMMDLALWYFNTIDAVDVLYQDTILSEREIEGKNIRVSADDIDIVRLSMGGGVTVICESDLVTPCYMNIVEIHGTNGSIITSIMSEQTTVVYCKEPRATFDRGRNEIRFPRIDLFERELQSFVDAIREDEGWSRVPIENELKMRGIIDKIGGGR